MKKIMLGLLLFVSASRAVDTLSIPTDFNTVTTGTRANLSGNFSSIQTWGNKVRDSIANVTGKISGFSGTLLIRSLSDLRLKLDYDNSETARFLVESGTGDSLFTVREDTTARFYKHLTVDSNLTVKRNGTFTGTLGVTSTITATGAGSFSNGFVRTGTTPTNGGSTNAGYLRVGLVDTTNVSIDSNNIQAMSGSGFTSMLYLNKYGGQVTISSSGNTTLFGGGINTSAPGTSTFADSVFVSRSISFASASTPPGPASGGKIRVYQTGSKIVFQYNDGGTVRYKYLDMSGTGVTWVATTVAP